MNEKFILLFEYVDYFFDVFILFFVTNFEKSNKNCSDFFISKIFS